MSSGFQGGKFKDSGFQGPPRPRTILTPEQFERAKSVGMGSERPLVHEIERAIRFAMRHRLFTADAITEMGAKKPLRLIVEADLVDFIAGCAFVRFNNGRRSGR
jgi:hypothetical protein